MDEKRIDLSIRLIFSLNFFWSFLVIQAIMTPFYTSRGLNAQQIVSIATIFSLTLLFLDIPTGYLADLFSRRWALIGAGFFKGLGGTILLMFQNYHGFICAFIMIGIGNSLFSGADLALLSELNSLRRSSTRSMSSLLSTRLSMGLLGAATSAILAGIIGSYSFKLALIVNCLVAWASVVIAIFIDQPEQPHRSARAKPDLKGFVLSLAQPVGNLRALMVTRIGLLTILLLHASILQILWQQMKVPLLWFGVLAASHGLVGAICAHLIAKGKIGINNRSLMLLIALLPLVGFVGSSLGTWFSVVGLGSGFLFELYRALVGSRMNAIFNESLPRNLLATGNSFASMGSRLGFVALSPIVGWSIMKFGLSWAFAGLAVLSALFAMVPLRLVLQMQSEKTDELSISGKSESQIKTVGV